MKLTKLVQTVLLSISVAGAAAVSAQVTFSINVGPPPLIFEPIPYMAPGYVWAPGYWAWNNDSHIWIRGRTIYQRPGYRWEPDRWEQRGSTFYRKPGSWMHDRQLQPARAQHGPRAQVKPRAQQPKRASGKPQKRGPWDDDQRDNTRR